LLKNNQKTYQLFNEYCIRTPLFPIQFYKKYVNTSRKELKEILLNAVFREAVFLASPELYHQIIRWEKGNLIDKQKVEKLQFSILKYSTRISTRCTPFGLFASCTTGKFDVQTNIQLKENPAHQRFTRFDTTFLTQLFQELLKQKAVKEAILFYPNTSIYKIGTHYRYVEYTIEKKKRSYSLEGIVYAEHIETILHLAKKGKTISELAFTLIDNEITKKEAISFIEELIDHQILVSELEITVTGNDYFKNLLHRIQQIPEASETYNQLLDLQKQLTQLDAKIGNQIDVYQSIIASAKEIVPQLDSNYLFQTDTFTATKNNTLNTNSKRQLNKAFVLFNKMTLPTADGNIERFKRNFLKRFEQSEVSLNLVLDTETGIGFGDKKEDTNDLLDDFSFFGNKKRYERIIWTDVDTILQKKLVASIQNKAYTITLIENDFKELPTTWDDLPDTFSSIIEVYKKENQEQIFMNGIGGASATYLLGRFAHKDKQLANHINDIVHIEKTINTDKILAEIVHLPEARTGNILQRPSFRDYEIPYLGKTNLASEYQISIEDILVSIKNDTIILRSKKLNKQILPRLGNAHNYDRNPLPIYQFLCEIQTQNKRSSIGFSWNAIFKKQPFLPRVEFENIIFSKARWNIEVKTFKQLFEKKEVLSSIKTWQKEYLMPDLVELVDGDNKLLINLKSKMSVKMLLDTVKNRTMFLLEEFLFTNDEIVKNKGGVSFCNQFVVSFYNEAKCKLPKNGTL
jgi:hypothetical protein